MYQVECVFSGHHDDVNWFSWFYGASVCTRNSRPSVIMPAQRSRYIILSYNILFVHTPNSQTIVLNMFWHFYLFLKTAFGKTTPRFFLENLIKDLFVIFYRICILLSRSTDIQLWRLLSYHLSPVHIQQLVRCVCMCIFVRLQPTPPAAPFTIQVFFRAYLLCVWYTHAHTWASAIVVDIAQSVVGGRTTEWEVWDFVCVQVSPGGFYYYYYIHFPSTNPTRRLLYIYVCMII